MSEGTAPARASASFVSARRTLAWSRSVTSSAPALRAAAIAFSDSDSDAVRSCSSSRSAALRRGEGGVALGLHRVEGPLAGVAEAHGVVRCGRVRGRVGAGWACGVGAGALAAGGVWGGVAPPAAGVAPAGLVGSLMRVPASPPACQSAPGMGMPASSGRRTGWAGSGGAAASSASQSRTCCWL